MRLYELLSGAGIECPEDLCDIDITKIVTDSRKASKGCMFVCIDGIHTDGHKFIKNAVSAGASVIVTETLRDECVGGAATVKVMNTRRAVSLLYNSWHGDPAGKLKIVGVTGTNGKTSVACILRHIFEKCGKRCGFVGTLGCFSLGKRIETSPTDPLSNMTTPDPEVLYAVLAKMVEDGVEYVFMEATSHASALCKLDAITFDTLIYTNLTRDHLDFHQSMENYLGAKAKLFERCRRAVINVDDKYAPDIVRACGAKEIVLCSCENKKCDFAASNILRGGGDGFLMRVRSEKVDIDVQIKVPLEGRFSPTNSLEAIAAASCYGIAKSELVTSLEDFSGVDGRMQKVEIKKDCTFSVYVDYAHTPDALQNILLSARDILSFEKAPTERGRLILLFGCGGERDRGKRKEMGRIASSLADFVIVTSDNCRGEDPCEIISDIYKGIDKEK